MEDRAPETKRRARLASPPVAFIVGILGLVALVTLILLVVYFVFGFDADGAEGP